MHPRFGAILGLAVVATARAQESSLDHALDFDAAAIDAKVESILRERDFPGCCIGIVAGPELAYAKAYGVASPATKEPAELDTLFQVGSVTKTITATLLVRLRELGLVTLDDPVAKHLPAEVEVPAHPRGGPITLRHLATHTSGLPSNPPNRRNVPDSPSVMQPYSVAELYEGLAATTLVTAPGQQFAYSNFGFGLLGHALERAGGKPFEELLRVHVFAPLGMDDSCVQLAPDKAARFAAHCWAGESPRVPRERWHFGEVSGFGGVISSVPDLARYVSAQFETCEDDALLLTAPSLRELHTPQFLIDRDWTTAIGLAWWTHRSPDREILVSHGGEVDGHSAFVGFSHEHGIGIVVLANVGGDAAETITRAVRPLALAPAIEQAKQLDALEKSKDWGALRDLAWEIVLRHPGHGRAWFKLGHAGLMVGEWKEAIEASANAARLGFSTAAAYYNVACGHARLEQKDDAFAALWKARRCGLSPEGVATDPDLESLRADRRWAELMQRE